MCSRVFQAKTRAATGSPVLALAMTVDPNAVHLAFHPSLDSSLLGTAIQQGFAGNVLPVGDARTELRIPNNSGTPWARGASRIATQRFFDVTAGEFAALTSQSGGLLT